MTYDDLVRKLRKLLPQDRHTLIDMLESEEQNDTAGPEPTLPSRLADGSDPQEYVNRLREAWHDRVKIHANSAR
jgi:hypothetical protein